MYINCYSLSIIDWISCLFNGMECEKRTADPRIKFCCKSVQIQRSMYVYPVIFPDFMGTFKIITVVC